MAQRKVKTSIVLDQEVDNELQDWAVERERSKRRQIAILLRLLIKIRKSSPDMLRQFELVS